MCVGWSFQNRLREALPFCLSIDKLTFNAAFSKVNQFYLEKVLYIVTQRQSHNQKVSLNSWDAQLLPAKGELLEASCEEAQPKHPMIAGYFMIQKTWLCDYPEGSFLPILNATT